MLQMPGEEDIVKADNAYKGAGFSEIIAIQNLLKELQPPQSGQHLHSWSDGLAMRVVPFGIALQVIHNLRLTCTN